MTHEPILRAIPCVWSRQLGSVACWPGDFSKAGTVCMWHSAVFKGEDQYNYLPATAYILPNKIILAKQDYCFSPLIYRQTMGLLKEFLPLKSILSNAIFILHLNNIPFLHGKANQSLGSIPSGTQRNA